MNNFCNNCGAQNTNSNFCTNCGSPMNNIQQANSNLGKLILSRMKSFAGSAIKIDIKVNGTPYALKNGESVALDLAPGIYQVSYKTIWRREKTVTVQIVQGTQHKIEFIYDAIWGGFKIFEPKQ